MLTVEEFIHYYLNTFETSKVSLNTKDNGNYYKGILVGSKYGVTGNALSLYLGKPVTANDIASIDLDLATNIALKFYYKDPREDILPWNTVTASLLDFGWGSGTKTAIKHFQELIGSNPDGIIGQDTLIKFKEKLSSMGEETVSNQFYDMRRKFLESLNQPTFLKGWLNRLDAMRYDSPIWRK